jgi:NitT/TauT family transport system substrate-binding protein
MFYVADQGKLMLQFIQVNLLRALVALVLLSVLLGCSQKSVEPMKVSLHAWSGYEPLFMAAREGWLDKTRVQLIESHTAADSIAALKTGAVDAAGLTFDEVLRARAEGIPITVIFVCDISAGADVVLARPEIRRIAQLKGKRIAVEQGALGALVLFKTLEKEGLTPADVTQVNIPPADQISAWKENKIDAVVSYEPVSMEVEKSGAIRLLDSRQIPDTIFDVLVVRQDVIEKNPEAIRHLVAAHLKGLNFFHSHPQDAAYRMSKHLALPANEVLASFKGLTLPDLANNHRLLAGNTPVLLGKTDSLSAILIQANLLKRADDKLNLVTAEFLPDSESPQ